MKAASIFCLVGYFVACFIAVAGAFGAEPGATIAQLERALAAERAKGDSASIADALEALGRLHQRGGDFPRAIARFEEALDLRRRLDSREHEAETRQSLCLSLQRAGRWDEAEACYAEVLVYARSSGEVALEAQVLNNLGGLDWTRGEADSALERYRRALELHRALGDELGEATTRVNRGALRRGLGEIEEALLDYEHASRLFGKVENRYWQARVANNIAVAYLALGDLDRARAHLLQALPLRREVGDRAGEAVTLRNLGVTYFRLGENGRARAYYEKALEQSLARGDRRGEATSRKLLGEVLAKDGDASAAREELGRALDIVRGMGKRQEEAETLERLARVHLDSGSTEGSTGGSIQEAERIAGQALELSRALRNPVAEVEALTILARVDRRRGRYPAAKERLDLALARLDEVQGRLGDPDRVASLLASRRAIHELAVDTTMALHAREPERGHHLAALETSERARARALLTALDPLDAPEKIEPRLADRLRRAERRFTGKTRRLLDLLDEAVEPSAIRAAEQERFAALDDLENVRAEIRRAVTRAGDSNLDAPFEPVEPAAIRALLDPETVLLEYFLGEERSFLWWVTTESITVHELAPRGEIEALAERAHRLVSAPAGRSSEVRGALDDLGRVLFEPVAERLASQRLAIAADGALHVVPFAALLSPRVDRAGRPLLADHEIVDVPSASVLAWHRRERRASPSSSPSPSPSSPNGARRTLAILADPIFDADDPRIDRPGGSTRPGDSDTLGRLPHTREEAEAIAALVPPEDRLVVLGVDARRELVTSGALADARVVHFATHGLVHPRAHGLSGLVLSRFDAEGREIDGFLDLHDLAGLDLSAELVVLSACRTALGEAVAGEGRVGPTRALLYAGVPRVVSSLWPVRDRATAELMTHFYRALLAGEPPASALRAAQLSLREERRYRAPYFWASFRLEGDWLPSPASSSAPQVPVSFDDSQDAR